MVWFEVSWVVVRRVRLVLAEVVSGGRVVGVWRLPHMLKTGSGTARVLLWDAWLAFVHDEVGFEFTGSTCRQFSLAA